MMKELKSVELSLSTLQQKNKQLKSDCEAKKKHVISQKAQLETREQQIDAHKRKVSQLIH